MNILTKSGANYVGAFGTKEDVDPINHLIFTAVGWGELPNDNTIAELGSVKKNDGRSHLLTVPQDVPVGAFWFVTVYDADGFIPENDLDIYSYNNVTAEGTVLVSTPLAFTSNDCLDIDQALDSPVSLDYRAKAPFKFNGAIEQVHIKYS